MKTILILIMSFLLIGCKVSFQTVDDVYYSTHRSKSPQYGVDSYRYYNNNVNGDFLLNYSDMRRDIYGRDWNSYYWNPYRPSYYGYQPYIIIHPKEKKSSVPSIKQPLVGYGGRNYNNTNNSTTNNRPPQNTPIRSYTPPQPRSSENKVISRPVRGSN